MKKKSQTGSRQQEDQRSIEMEELEISNEEEFMRLESKKKRKCPGWEVEAEEDEVLEVGKLGGGWRFHSFQPVGRARSQ